MPRLRTLNEVRHLANYALDKVSHCIVTGLGGEIFWGILFNTANRSLVGHIGWDHPNQDIAPDTVREYYKESIRRLNEEEMLEE